MGQHDSSGYHQQSRQGLCHELGLIMDAVEVVGHTDKVQHGDGAIGVHDGEALLGDAVVDFIPAEGMVG